MARVRAGVLAEERAVGKLQQQSQRADELGDVLVGAQHLEVRCQVEVAGEEPPLIGLVEGDVVGRVARRVDHAEGMARCAHLLVQRLRIERLGAAPDDLSVEGNGLWVPHQRQGQGVGEGRAVEVVRGDNGVARVILVVVGQDELIGVDRPENLGEFGRGVRGPGIDEHAVDEVDP